MKVTIDIDPVQISLGVLEILRSLPESEKQRIAGEIIKDWLSVTHDQEKQIYEKEIATTLMRRSGKKESDIREGYEFREAMKEYVSVREKMIKTILDEGVRLFKSTVEVQIQSSEYIQDVFSKAMDVVRINFPTYVQNAVAQWFINQMSSIQDQTMNYANDTYFQIANLNTTVDEIKRRLGM